MIPSKETPALFVETLLRLGRAEVDDLPYGLVLLDEAGTILLYNRYESSMSHRPPESVVGKNWFHDVAPCTRVSAFYGRFRDFLAGSEPSASFWFWFHFLHGSQLVDVVFLRSTQAGQVLLTVTRRLSTLPDQAASALPAVLDGEAGALRAPYGLGLVLPPDLFELCLESLGSTLRRRAGEELGRRCAAVADHLASGEQGQPLRALETVLAMRLIDRIIAGAGLGRLTLDAVASAPTLRLVVCPPTPVGYVLGEFYEGLLERLASFLAGRPLAVIWADHDTPERLPWHYDVSAASQPVRPSYLEEGEMPTESPPGAGSVGALFANVASPDRSPARPPAG